MQESCYCGRTGEIGDRKAVRDGHLDHLSWLQADAREHVFGEAERRDGDERMPLTA